MRCCVDTVAVDAKAVGGREVVLSITFTAIVEAARGTRWPVVCFGDIVGGWTLISRRSLVGVTAATSTQLACEPLEDRLALAPCPLLATVLLMVVIAIGGWGHARTHCAVGRRHRIGATAVRKIRELQGRGCRATC